MLACLDRNRWREEEGRGRIQSIDFVGFVVIEPISKAFVVGVRNVANNCESIETEIDHFSVNRCMFPETIRFERKLMFDFFRKSARERRIRAIWYG